MLTSPFSEEIKSGEFGNLLSLGVLDDKNNVNLEGYTVSCYVRENRCLLFKSNASGMYTVKLFNTTDIKNIVPVSNEILFHMYNSTIYPEGVINKSSTLFKVNENYVIGCRIDANSGFLYLWGIFIDGDVIALIDEVKMSNFKTYGSFSNFIKDDINNNIYIVYYEQVGRNYAYQQCLFNLNKKVITIKSNSTIKTETSFRNPGVLQCYKKNGYMYCFTDYQETSSSDPFYIQGFIYKCATLEFIKDIPTFYGIYGYSYTLGLLVSDNPNILYLIIRGDYSNPCITIKIIISNDVNIEMIRTDYPNGFYYDTLTLMKADNIYYARKYGDNVSVFSFSGENLVLNIYHTFKHYLFIDCFGSVTNNINFVNSQDDTIVIKTLASSNLKPIFYKYYTDKIPTGVAKKLSTPNQNTTVITPMKL